MSKPSQRSSTPTAIAKTPTTPNVVARVQGVVARQHGGGVPKGNYLGRMQKTVAGTVK